MRYLVFGGGGFLGGHLVGKLLEKRGEIVVFSRRSLSQYKNLIKHSQKIHFVKGDLNNKKSFEKIIRCNDIVLDLVASSVPFSSAKNPIEEIKKHIFSHAQLIEIAFRKKVKKFIFASSGGGIYGETGKLPVSEDAQLSPMSPHAIGKATIENYLYYFHKIYEIPYIVYRISNPYGPLQKQQDGFGIIPTLFNCVLEKRNPILFDNGRIIRDFIYIEDVIEAIVRSFNKNTQHQVYNIGSGEGTTLLKLWDKIKKITGSDLKPKFQKKRSIDVESIILDNDRFRREFRWKQSTSLQSGLKKTWNWHLTQSVGKESL